MSKIICSPGSHLEALQDRINALGRAVVAELNRKSAAGASSAEVEELGRRRMEPVEALQDRFIQELGYPLSRARLRALRAAAQAQGALQ